MKKTLLSTALIGTTFISNLALAGLSYDQLPFPNKCSEVTSLLHVNEANRVLCRTGAITYGIQKGLLKTPEDLNKPEIIDYFKKCFIKSTLEVVPTLVIDKM